MRCSRALIWLFFFCLTSGAPARDKIIKTDVCSLLQKANSHAGKIVRTTAIIMTSIDGMIAVSRVPYSGTGIVVIADEKNNRKNAQVLNHFWQETFKRQGNGRVVIATLVGKIQKNNRNALHVAFLLYDAKILRIIRAEKYFVCDG